MRVHNRMKVLVQNIREDGVIDANEMQQVADFVSKSDDCFWDRLFGRSANVLRQAKDLGQGFKDNSGPFAEMTAEAFDIYAKEFYETVVTKDDFKEYLDHFRNGKLYGE